MHYGLWMLVDVIAEMLEFLWNLNWDSRSGKSHESRNRHGPGSRSNRIRCVDIAWHRLISMLPQTLAIIAEWLKAICEFVTGFLSLIFVMNFVSPDQKSVENEITVDRCSVTEISISSRQNELKKRACNIHHPKELLDHITASLWFLPQMRRSSVNVNKKYLKLTAV
jgi:hypothetical protein